mmetsp:Transcript_27342/g.52041  ORF Transcript_27342/g.52041 Transcript_27342/m.52041 type:complete len:214 (-) Transcript_27342:215-856(-)
MSRSQCLVRNSAFSFSRASTLTANSFTALMSMYVRADGSTALCISDFSFEVAPASVTLSCITMNLASSIDSRSCAATPTNWTPSTPLKPGALVSYSYITGLKRVTVDRPREKFCTFFMLRWSAGVTHMPPPGLRASKCCTRNWLERVDRTVFSVASPNTTDPLCSAVLRCPDANDRFPAAVLLSPPATTEANPEAVFEDPPITLASSPEAVLL